MRERVTILAIASVGLFILISLLGTFILVWAGKIEGDETAWRPLYDLVAIILGSIAGYIGGTEVERNRHHHRDNQHDDRDES